MLLFTFRKNIFANHKQEKHHILISGYLVMLNEIMPIYFITNDCLSWLRKETTCCALTIISISEIQKYGKLSFARDVQRHVQQFLP